ncbi:LysE family transporter [Streptomyces sp. NP160]|uniref:LysE family transporter n=1 Tax=Streptomyces sp. NP160 TaxID=2586637 RepID=UPI0015D5AA40|nr:LysE family transporter [Streptomyces sp. NP160]
MDPLVLGLLVGLASAAPLGPQNAYLLQVGLQLPTARAWGAAALVVGLDVSVSLVGAGLAGRLLSEAPHLRVPALVVGAAVLLVMGGQILWRTRPRRAPRHLLALGTTTAATGAVPGAAVGGWSRRRLVLGALAVTWLNPSALLDSSLLFGGLVASARLADLPVLVLGLCAASVLWTAGFVGVLRAVRARLVERARCWVERAAGAVVVVVGLRFAAQAAGVL